MAGLKVSGLVTFYRHGYSHPSAALVTLGVSRYTWVDACANNPLTVSGGHSALQPLIPFQSYKRRLDELV